ncbi:hypothetical protein [Symbioplanes lichenis]|uniref:hypothetical protein n=1 Tax=Symbioplanes lichenis TaxID=1629072 RepID=UPI00273A2C16|nr:hypothetical protein [Actinoplanes lichenis]
MSQPEEAVIEFGPAESAGEPDQQRRRDVGGFLAGLGRDRRVVPLTAGLGALALFASLVSEWQVTSFDGRLLQDGAAGARPFSTTVAEVTGWGPAYLVGLFLMVTAVVLALFGPASGRPYARLAALSTGGVLFVVVAAAYSALSDTSQVITEFQSVIGFEEPEMGVDVGRGVWCALVGVVLVTVAAYLSGRASEPAAEEKRPRRRPHVEAEDDPRPETPFELEVTAAKPWQVTGDSRDKPGEGISG